MEPKEKAFELLAKMEKDFQYFASREIVIQHALIAVDEIIKILKDNDLYIGGETNIDEIIRFWEEVKQEIEKL